jgi:uncharacterized lipoprotein YbaY
MNFLQYLWLAIRIERNRKLMWSRRTVYTFSPRPDTRDTLRFWRNSWRS